MTCSFLLTPRNLSVLHRGAPHNLFEISVKCREIVVAAKGVYRGYAVILFNKRGGVIYARCVEILLEGRAREFEELPAEFRF